MYNEELKQEYINYKLNENRNFTLISTRIFKKSENKENILNKDISNFTITEIIDLYKSFCSTSYESLNVITSAYKGYTDWCIEQGYVEDNQNHFKELTTDLINNCINYAVKNSSIFTREEIYHIVDDLRNSSDAALVLCLFEGICGKEMCELVNLKPTDFNQDGTVSLCTGRKIKVSAKLKSLCIDSSEEYIYISNVTPMKLAEDCPNVFKPDARTPRNEINRKGLYNKLAKIKQYLSIPTLTNNMLLESGRIEMINRMLEEDPQLTVSYIANKNMTKDVYGEIYCVKTYLSKYGDRFPEDRIV